MHHFISLNELYADYAAGLLNRKDFEGSIFQTIRENINCFGLVGWNREDSDDYISSLYPRISKSIDTYHDIGASFESYIGSIVRLTAREYRARKMSSYCEEDAAWIAHLPEMYACENEVEYDEQTAANTTGLRAMTTPRQLLILILKCSSHVSADQLEKMAPRLGMAPDALSAMIDELKQMQERRAMDILALREKMNSYFYRCILYEKKLQTLMPESLTAQRIRKKLKLGRNRLEKTRRQLARSRIDPSNAQIAQLLGITKGTVDSVLYNLRVQNAARGAAQGAARGALYPVIDPERFQ